MKEYNIYPRLQALAGLGLGFMLTYFILSIIDKNKTEIAITIVGILISLGWLYTIYEMQWR